VSPARPTVTVVGRRLAPEDHRLRDFLTRTAQPYEWLEAGSPEAVESLAAHGVAEAEMPVVLDGGTAIPGANVERLVEAWQGDRTPSRSTYDLAIVGAGPAGFAAAVYAASDGLSTLVLERDVPGGQAAMHLGNAGARVTMAVRGERLGRSMSAYLVERIAAHPLIDVRLQAEVVDVDAEDDHLAGVTLRDARGAAERISARALFLCIGGKPRTAWADDAGVRVDGAGFIETGPDLLRDGRRPKDWPLDRDPLALETSVPGLFAAGDVRSGSTKRVAGAVGEGAMAVALAHRRLEELARAH
jgi:thioredoxin reductase